MAHEHIKLRPRPIAESLREYGRGIAGGLIFSVPLLYTLEVWWRGVVASPATLLTFLGATLVLLLGYNRYGGMHHSASLGAVVVESIEEMGLGLLIAAGILFLMDRITFSMPLAEITGKIVIEAMTVAVGVSVGTAQLGAARERGDDADSPEDTDADAARKPHGFGQLVMAFCGAILVASNVAPTEEIVTLAISAPWEKLLGLAALSLGVGALVLNFSGFVGANRHVRNEGLFWMGYGMVSSYAAALLASALLLWFFGRFDAASPSLMVAETVVLGLPAVLGASAGRLLIQ